MGWLTAEQEDVLFGAFYVFQPIGKIVCGEVLTVCAFWQVMTEGVNHDHGAAMMRKTYFFLMIDLGQVLRGLTNTRYGWTLESSNAVRYVDLVWNIESLISRLIPRYFFFIVASMLVIISLADAVYVFHLFKAGQLSQMWPVKLLRALVLTIVTVSFSALLKWLLIPIECLGNDHSDGLVPYLHGEGAECKPFAAPDIALSLPTLVLALLYIAFALVNCLLTFEVNPLSRRPRSSCTGRVEFSWMLYKLSASILIYFSNIITPVTVAIIEFLQSMLLLRNHLRVFPFNSFKLNVLRGGIFAAIHWLSFSNLVVASIHVGGSMHADTEQVVQWGLIASIPILFLLGMVLTYHTRKNIYLSTERLRGEWSRTREILGTTKSEHSEEPSEDPNKAPVKRSIYEKFYHSSWETWRAFQNGQEGLTTARLLLFKRREEDKPFLSYVLRRAIEEHPDQNAIYLFSRMMQAFVFNDHSGPDNDQQKLSDSERGFRLDQRYIVYAIDRKKSQDEARKGVGRDTVSAINLMEFNSGMMRARRDHLLCIQARRKFWHAVKKMIRHAKKGQLQDDLFTRIIESLDSMHNLENAARNEYHRLLANFKTSASLNRTYADFADLILNDEVQKFKYLRAASAIDGEDQGADSDGDNGDAASQDKAYMQTPSKPSGPTAPAAMARAGSIASGSSASESARQKVYRQIKNILPFVLGEPMALMRSLTLQSKCAMVFIFALATVGFSLLEFVLFQQQAETYLHLIEGAGGLETAAVTGAYLLRSQLLAGVKNDSATVERIRVRLDNYMLGVQHTMWEDYDGRSSGSVEDYFQKEFAVFVPLYKDWHIENQSFWQFGNAYTRKVMMAGASNVSHWADFGHGTGGYLREQGTVDYVHENLVSVLHAFEGLAEQYVDLMHGFGRLVVLVVSIMAAFNGVTLLLVLALFIRALKVIIHNVQYEMVILDLAMSLPSKAVKRIHRVFEEEENRWRDINDDGEQALGVMNTVFEDENNNEGAPLAKPLALKQTTSFRNNDSTAGSPVPRVEGSILRRSGGGSPMMPIPTTASLLTEKAVEEHISMMEAAASQDGTAGGWGLPIRRPVDSMEHHSEGSYPNEHDAVGVAGEKFGEVSGSGTPQPEHEEIEIEIASDDGAGVGVLGSRFGHVEEAADAQPPADLDLQVWEDRFGRDEQAGAAQRTPTTVVKVVELRTVDHQPNHHHFHHHQQHEAHAHHHHQQQQEDHAHHHQQQQQEAHAHHHAHTGEHPHVHHQSHADQPMHGEGSAPAHRKRRDSSGSEEEEEEQPAGHSPLLESAALRSENVTVSAMLVHAVGGAAGANGGDWSETRKTMKRNISFSDDGAEDPLVALEEAQPVAKPLKRQALAESFKDVCGSDRVAEVNRHLQEVLIRRRAWFLKKRTFFFAFIVLPALAIFSLEYPARGAETLVHFAPVMFLNTHRQYLSRKCAWLVRELVYNDGLSRLRQSELAYELSKSVDKMERVDKAIRLGGDLDNKQGADEYSQKHNEVMYEIGCQWREDQDQCSSEAYPGVSFQGLYSYIQAYLTAVKTALSRYGPPQSEFEAPTHDQLPSHDDDFAGVKDDLAAREALFSSDPDLKYIVENVLPEGDIQLGFGIVAEDFFYDAGQVLSQVRFEARAFYGVYVAALLLFYTFLFRRVQFYSTDSAVRARSFVLKLPTHLLAESDVETIVAHFNNEGEHDEPETRDA